ncbi:MAG: hypothetical protein HY909_04850 [Deltaproteobacteria bacterium]|nr:hypothetical protein [Deltaproteobacteria bacterium]
MRLTWLPRSLVMLGLCVGVVAPGCAEERAPIDQVQPDALDKTNFIPVSYAALVGGARPGSLTPQMVAREPQWHLQVTVVDKPANTGAAGVSSYTQVERVQWEVTESLLIARQGYEQYRDAQANAARPGVGNNPRQGEVLAAFRITSHFDIQRSYNASTGERLNVRVENSTDRPWYQRQFMRVNWSQNLIGDYNPVSSRMWSGRIRMEFQQPNWVNNPEDPNRPVFDYGTHAGQPNTLRYFDVTNRVLLHTEEAGIPGLPGVPACYLYDRITESCLPADVSMRWSFRRLDPTRDYQPVALDGHRMERYGFFYSDQNGFSPHLGTAGQLERRYWANRHNLWMQHHARVANNGLDHKPGDAACTTDADCSGTSRTARCDTGTRTCGEIYLRCAPSERIQDPVQRQASADMQCAAVGSGAACDTDIATTRGDRLGLCLLPYRSRTVRPLAYHLSQNYPERLMPVTNSINQEWNRVFSYTVQQARYRECLLDPAGGGAAGCRRWTDPASPGNTDSRFVWVQCHNPVWGTATGPGQHTAMEVAATRDQGWDLPDACGPQGTSARLGDIRYNMIASVNELDAQGPWGLANISGDPETGEVLWARGAVWQTVTDSQAAFATDMVRVLNRDVSPEQFALGQTILDTYDYIRALGAREERTPEQRASDAQILRPRPVHRDYQSAEEIQTILNQTTFDHLRTISPESAEALDANAIDALSEEHRPGEPAVRNHRAFLRNLVARYQASLPSGAAQETSQQSMARLRGTRMEQAFMNREALLGAGFDPERDANNPLAMDAVSPARFNNMAFRQLRERWETLMEQHECRYSAEAQLDDDVIATMLYRFRHNEVPADVRFGRSWNFLAQGADPARCANEAPELDAEGRSNCPLNYDEIQNYIVQYMQYGVMLHELGHSVGERHNFSASADAMNYGDRYWELRRTAGTMATAGAAAPRADRIRPRWEHQAMGQPFYSPEEERQGVEEYAYSSVMDYKGWNLDAHGLMRYDRAFVLHGYADLVEAFDRVANPTEALIASESWNGGYQSAYRIGFSGTSTAPRAVSYHYTDIPRLIGVREDGNPDIRDDNRYPVFLRETTRQGYGAFNWSPDHTNQTNANRDGTRSETPHVLVPYMFGTDDWANYIWNTQRYDTGPDMYESMRYVSKNYQDYYFSNAFSRNRATFTVNGYRGRLEGRYFDQAYYSMRNATYLTSIYQNIIQGVPGDVANSTQVTSARLGAAMITDMFINAIVMPQSSASNRSAGRHCQRTRTDGSTVWDRGVQGSLCVDVPLGAGREFSSYYDFGSGFFWRYRITNAGSYHDKQISLDYLTETFNWVPGRTVIEFQDVHPLQINLYTMFPDQTVRFYGSLLSRDHDDIGPQVRPRAGMEPEILRTQFARLNLPAGTGMNQSGRNPALRAIDPNIGFTLELEAAAYLYGQLRLTFDRTARTSARLWADGDTWALQATPERRLVDFTNPFTGQVFHAVHIGGGMGELGERTGLSRRDTMANETGIAGRMLVQANRLADAWRNAPMSIRNERRNELQNYLDLLERVRDLSGWSN